MNVLVTDGQERSALAVVRSLGRAGHRVDVLALERRSLAGASRYAEREGQGPDPLRTPDDFLGVVKETVERRSIDCLIPISEASLRAILPRREIFERTQIPFPSYESFAAASDKAEAHAAAQEVGLAVPRQIRVEGKEAIPADVDGLGFPVVVKPTRSVVRVGGEGAETKVRNVPDREELAETLSRLPEHDFPVLIQERISGPGRGVFLLIWNGELRAAFSHRRIREKPPSGGVSVLRESARLAPDIVDKSRRLLEQFGWQGVAMVEFKSDEKTRTPYLMEINGRFWGSVQLAVDAGVDFPRLLLEALEGAANPDVVGYNVGLRLQWLWGHVDHCLSTLGTDRTPTGTDDRWFAPWTEFLREAFRSRSEVLRRDDPRPFLRETKTWLADLFASSS